MEAISLGRRVLARNYGDDPEPYDDPKEREQRLDAHAARINAELRSIEAGEDPALVKDVAPMFVTLREVGRVVVPEKKAARRRVKVKERRLLFEQIEE